MRKPSELRDDVAMLAREARAVRAVLAQVVRALRPTSRSKRTIGGVLRLQRLGVLQR